MRHEIINAYGMLRMTNFELHQVSHQGQRRTSGKMGRGTRGLRSKNRARFVVGPVGFILKQV